MKRMFNVTAPKIGAKNIIMHDYTEEQQIHHSALSISLNLEIQIEVSFIKDIYRLC